MSFTGNRWAYRKGRECVGSRIKGVHWTIICLCILKTPQVASLAVSVRTTFEAIVRAWLDLDLPHVAFDMCSSGGVVDRNSVQEMSQRIRLGKPLVVVDPMQPGWNLCGKVTQEILDGIAGGMRTDWQQYWDNPSLYWEQQRQFKWPEPLVEPTAQDWHHASYYPPSICIPRPPVSAPAPRHPWPAHPLAASAAVPLPAASADVPLPTATWQAAGLVVCTVQPQPALPFDTDGKIIVLAEQGTYNIRGLRFVPVQLLTCEWWGTSGYLGQFSLSLPRNWQELSRLPVILVLPGADDRRLCTEGPASKLNEQAQAAFKSAVIIECNAAVPGKKGQSWAYQPQLWMADLALYVKSALSTHLIGIGFSRGTSWLIQLAAQRPGTFDKLVLIAPYPPPNMPDAVCGQAIVSSFANLQNILAVGSDIDEFACTEKAHPEFWQRLAKRGMPNWIKLKVGHGQFETGVWRSQEAQWANIQSTVFNFALAPPVA